ncbi:AMSH ubiquitin thioesterase 1 [Spatholobus suberectus]|nr:AMSH ubiquitin thioesterase 1 [Spatholobus suberectus]
MRSSSDRINIAASAQKLDVDNRIALRFYHRIADNILRQADIFRAEKNIIDLYVMLLRFSSLVSETIPRHRDYRSSPQRQKESLKKKLLISLNELETLKPVVQQKINELNNKLAYQQMVRPTAGEFVYQGSRSQQFSYVRPVEEHVRRLSLTLPPPKEETLSRHSILGPNGLKGQWRPPATDKRHSLEDESLNKKDNSIAEQLKSDLDSILTQSEDCQPQPQPEPQHQHDQEPPSLISFETTETPAQIEVIRQPSPPPVLAEVQDLVPAVSPCVNEAGFNCIDGKFYEACQVEYKKNLETCGVLAGLLKNRKFYITALIIPKQESTSDSCQTTNEEEIFEVQDKRSLFPLGWIHTHPTQSCFMSSIDVHTHYSYQIMLPEAVAIVMAPTDSSRKHGIFRLTAPGGMSVIKQCDQRGFHPHSQPPDGGPIYETCTDVYMNPDLKFDVIDLR